MGDRSNIFIQQHERDGQWIGIGVYSHWGGTSMQEAAIVAASESVERLGDPSYFARRVIHKVLNACADPDSPVGCGLWTETCDDNEYPVLVINAHTGLAWTCGDAEIHNSAPADAKHVESFHLVYED